MSLSPEFQRHHLNQLADSIRTRNTPLGVGLRNQCWAGVAIGRAREEGIPATEYFGLSFSEIKRAIKINNLTPEPERNRVMAEWSERKACRIV